MSFNLPAYAASLTLVFGVGLSACASKPVDRPIEVKVPVTKPCPITAPEPAGDRPALLDIIDPVDLAAATITGNYAALMAYAKRLEAERDGWKGQAMGCAK